MIEEVIDNQYAHLRTNIQLQITLGRLNGEVYDELEFFGTNVYDLFQSLTEMILILLCQTKTYELLQLGVIEMNQLTLIVDYITNGEIVIDSHSLDDSLQIHNVLIRRVIDIEIIIVELFMFSVPIGLVAQMMHYGTLIHMFL